jgi:uncharacterized protein (DUF305 family)
MRITIFGLVLITISLGFTACNKDADDMVLQAHDDNRMMDSMHVMMARMEAMTMTMDPEVDFSEMMMMHHEGALNMSRALVADGKNDSLKRFAQKVITDQTAEIAVLKAIRMSLTVNNMDMDFMQEQMDNMEKTSKQADVQLITGDIDNDYATLMMIHHQAAIQDASAYLHHGDNAQLKTIANNIITAQNKEIIELSNWLKNNKR